MIATSRGGFFFPIDEQHERKGGVDDVAITTQRERSVGDIIIGRKGSKWYNNKRTTITTINHNLRREHNDGKMN